MHACMHLHRLSSHHRRCDTHLIYSMNWSRMRNDHECIQFANEWEPLVAIGSLSKHVQMVRQVQMLRWEVHFLNHQSKKSHRDSLIISDT